jgi:hypothetical protein
LRTVMAYEPNRKDPRSRLILLSYEYAQELSPDDFMTANDLSAAIEGLRYLRKRVEQEPVISIFPESGPSFLFALIMTLLLVTPIVIILDVVDFYLKKRIKDARDASSIKIGQKKFEVLAAIGAWGRRESRVENSTDYDELWHYVGYGKFFIRKSLPGVAIFLSDGIVTRIDYLQ